MTNSNLVFPKTIDFGCNKGKKAGPARLLRGVFGTSGLVQRAAVTVSMIILTMTICFSTSLTAAEVIPAQEFAGYNLQLTEVTPRSQTVIPQGSFVDVMEFKLEGINNTSGQFNSVKIRNESPVVFGNGVDKVFLYKDTGNHIFDEDNDELIDQYTFTIGTYTQYQFYNLNETVPSGQVDTYYIIYELSSEDNEAVISATTNVILNSINGIVINPGVDNDQIFDISGFVTYNAVDISPDTVLPGQSKVPMLELNFSVEKEDVERDVIIAIKNSGVNFVTSPDSADGVTALYLYKDDGFTQPEYVLEHDKLLVRKITAEDFDSASETVVSFNANEGSAFKQQLKRFPEGQPVKFYIFYDIGDDFNVAVNDDVAAQMLSVQGQGSKSYLSIEKSKATPDQPATASVAGMTYQELDRIVPQGANFGSGTVCPILSMKIRAHHADVSLNALILNSNYQTDRLDIVKYISTQNAEDGIKKISIYEDSNDNESFDGSDSEDTLIGRLELGKRGITGTLDSWYPVAGNSPKLAIVTFNIPVYDPISETWDASHEYQVQQGDYNEKMLFVIYHFGLNIPEGIDPSGNPRTTAISQLREGVGYSVIESEITTINFSGALPASAVPEAQVDLTDISVFVVENGIQDLSPTSVVQGQLMVPMMHLTIYSHWDISSTNIEIFNEKSTFINNHKGIYKVWMFRDVDPPTPNVTPVFAPNDYMVAVNDDIAADNLVILENVTLKRGQNQFFIFYDIGQVTPVETFPNVKAQLNQVVSISDTARLYGGMVPDPKKAESYITPKRVQIQEITNTFDNSLTGTSTFNVHVRVKNVSPFDVELTENKPKFYLDNIDGMDISAEFKIINLIPPPANYPVMAPGTVETLTYEVRRDRPFKEGTVQLDAYVKYMVPVDGAAIVSRYFNGVAWYPGCVGPRIPFNIKSIDTTYDWTLPTYIERIDVQSGGVTKLFINYDAIQPSSKMQIYLINKGREIDEASIHVMLNSAALSRSTGPGISAASVWNPQEEHSMSFYYDRNEGVISIDDIGRIDSSLMVYLDSMDGVPLDTGHISFSISDVIRIERPLFFPSPYHVGSRNLNLGFSLTKDAVVKIYLFNHLGTLVWEHEHNGFLGYNLVDIHVDSPFLRPGMYYCKLLAEDENGEKTVETTKLAIY
ncbi:hypothetical protein ACFL96_00700 [Thermoproteota archaeon]